MVVSAEAASIACIYRYIVAYFRTAPRRAQAQVRGYTEFIIHQAWPAQAGGQLTDDATRRLNTLEQTLVRYEPATLHQMNGVTALRRKRLHAIGDSLPSVMWWVLLVGAALTIGVTYLLQIQRTIQLVLTAFLPCSLGRSNSAAVLTGLPLCSKHEAGIARV